MGAKELREKLHHIIDKSSAEELLKTLSFIENNYTDEFKASLDAGYDDSLKNGTAFSQIEVNKSAEALIKPGNRNSL